MRKISFYTSVFSFLLSFVGFSQIETGKKTVQTLCSPEFHGRGYVMVEILLLRNTSLNNSKKLAVHFLRILLFKLTTLQ